MTAQEAHEFLVKKYKGLVAIDCHEFDSVYVFHAVPEEIVDTDKAVLKYDSLYSIDKKTGECRGFNPMMLSPDDYNRGKKIPVVDFKSSKSTDMK